MRLADYVIERLCEAGIGHAFTVAGGGAAFLDDALRVATGMRYVCCHHEQAAAMAAEAYARARTDYGLAVVTSGPGATNAITGVAGAWTDSVPVVVLSGQVFSTQMMGSRKLRTLGVQEIDIIPMVRPITKYAVTVTEPASIRYDIERALWEAKAGRHGPVWLDLPADVQNAQIDPDGLVGYTPSSPQAPDLASPVGTVLELLRDARRPLLHVGQGVRLAGARATLLRFLAASRMPVVTARNGNDLVPSDHPCYIGRPGTFAQRGANFAVQTSDLYIAIGTRLGLAQTGYNAGDYARRAKVVQVDIDADELGKGTVRVDVPVRANAREFLRCLLQQNKEAWPDWSGWLARCKGWQAKYPPVTDAQRERREGRYVNSYHLVDELSEQAEPDDIIVTDMGFSFQCTHQAWRVKDGQRLMTNSGLAAMGWGLPAAIGAAVGTGRRVIAIVGDGGLMMNMQELATLAHHGWAVKIFVLNNGGYLTMRQSQAHAFGAVMGSDAGSGLSFPRFKALALAHRLAYLKCYDPLALRGQIAAALHREDPVLVEVMMDPEQPQVPKSINRRLPDSTIKQTAIEDAWPYLPAEELAENLAVDG